ncbi:hypothetical protein Tco_1020770 [Tanacetum coccineum]
MLKIYPKLPSQIFEEPPLEEEILSFIIELGHTGDKHGHTKKKPKTTDEKIAIERSKIQQMKIAIDIQSKVPDEQQQNIYGTNEGAGDKPKVPDVPDHRSESEQESWTYSQGEDDEDNDEHDSENNNDDEDDDQENVKENQEDDDDAIGGEQEDEEDEELYGDLNLNLYRRDAEMTDAQNNQETEKVHVSLTTEPLVVQQQSSSISSDLVSKFINPSPDTGIDSILNPNVQSDILVNVSVSATTETPSFDTIIPQPPIPIIQPQQQTHDSTTTTTLPEIPNFASLFALSSIFGIVDNYLASKMKDAVNVAVQLKSNKLKEEAQAENDEFLKQIDSNIKTIIKDQVKAQVSKIMPKVEKYVTESLGAEVLARSSNQPQTSYVVAASLSEFELKKILIDKIEENKSMNRSDIQKNLYNTLIESYNSDKDLFASYGDVVTLKKGRDDQDKDEEPSARSNRGTKYQLKSSGKFDQAKEHGEIIAVDERLWNPSGSQTPDRKWNKTKTVDDRPPQSWMTQLAQASGT